MVEGGSQSIIEKLYPFYSKIEAVLKEFAAAHNMEYSPWYHDEPTFIFRWPDTKQQTTSVVLRAINVYIYPGVEDKALMYMYVNVFSDKDNPDGTNPKGRRLRSFHVMKGELPRDESIIGSWLWAAREIALAVREEDLFDIERWQEFNSKLQPLFEAGI